MVELRQSREISTAQMVYTRLIGNIEHNSRIYGENLATTLAKACHDPEGLNDAEVIALYSYFQNRMDLVFISYSGATIGTFQRGLGPAENWQATSVATISNVLSYPSGRQWIETNPFWGNRELAKSNQLIAFVQSFNLTPPFGNCEDRRNSLTPTI